MKRVLWIAACLGVLLSLFGCSILGKPIAGGVQSSGTGFLALPDLSGYPINVVIGISGPYSTKERMVQEAILGCARLVALGEAVAVDNKIVTQWDSKKGLRSFATKANAYYDDTTLAQIVERLEILQVLFDKEAGAVVIAKDTQGKMEMRPSSGGVGPDGKPLWITTMVRSDSHRFGVGSSGPYRFLNNALEAADFEAAQNLLDLQTDHLFATGYTKTSDGSVNATMETGIYQASKALLQGFTVVSRYHDTDTNTYWSLVAVPK